MASPKQSEHRNVGSLINILVTHEEETIIRHTSSSRAALTVSEFIRKCAA